ncbi:putative xylitol transport system permease protein [Streptomyces misionensis JCM 4497]
MAAVGHLGGGRGRDSLPRLLGRRPALALHALLHRDGLGGRLLPAGLPAHRRHSGADPGDRRRSALQRRRGRLRHQAAQPVTALVRLPRGLPLPHPGGVRRPLRGHLTGRLPARLTLPRHRGHGSREPWPFPCSAPGRGRSRPWPPPPSMPDNEPHDGRTTHQPRPPPRPLGRRPSRPAGTQEDQDAGGDPRGDVRPHRGAGVRRHDDRPDRRPGGGVAVDRLPVLPDQGGHRPHRRVRGGRPGGDQAAARRGALARHPAVRAAARRPGRAGGGGPLRLQAAHPPHGPGAGGALADDGEHGGDRPHAVPGHRRAHRPLLRRPGGAGLRHVADRRPDGDRRVLGRARPPRRPAGPRRPRPRRPGARPARRRKPLRPGPLSVRC